MCVIHAMDSGVGGGKTQAQRKRGTKGGERKGGRGRAVAAAAGMTGSCACFCPSCSGTRRNTLDVTRPQPHNLHITDNHLQYYTLHNHLPPRLRLRTPRRKRLAVKPLLLPPPTTCLWPRVCTKRYLHACEPNHDIRALCVLLFHVP